MGLMQKQDVFVIHVNKYIWFQVTMFFKLVQRFTVRCYFGIEGVAL